MAIAAPSANAGGAATSAASAPARMMTARAERGMVNADTVSSRVSAQG
jgi:hypothetical protein